MLHIYRKQTLIPGHMLLTSIFCLVFLLWESPRVSADDASPADNEVDVLLTNAEVHRGDGTVLVDADVAIRGDRIVGVGDREWGSVSHTIDCAGLVVCPGFIDLHNHSDEGIVSSDRRSAMNYLMQGCTTLVTGNCGGGPTDVEAYYRSIDKLGAGANVAHLVPQGDVRREVIGTERRPATPEEMRQMREITERAMRDGAWGMSSGLIYVPSSYADTEELASLAEVVAKYQGIYASHIRNEGTGLLDAVDEALLIGQRAKLAVHISHFKSSGKDSWGLVRVAVEKINAARRDGMRVTADQYPYTASSTSLRAILLPAWARAGSRAQMLARLQPSHADSEKALKAVRDKLQVTDNGHRIQIASHAKRPEWSGRRLDEIAQEEGLSTLELFMKMQRDGGASVVNHSINEQDVQFVMQQPWVATASDGSAKVPGYRVPHPRSFGTFPRKIGHYSQREQVLSLSQAIRSSTGLPSVILGFKDRGFVREGQFADVVVFDKQEFIDTATYEKPYQYNRGLEHVFVNGQPVVFEGQATGALAGRALRKRGG